MESNTASIVRSWQKVSDRSTFLNNNLINNKGALEVFILLNVFSVGKFISILKINNVKYRILEVT